MEHSSFFAPSLGSLAPVPSPFMRIWHAFLVGRIALAAVLLLQMLGNTLEMQLQNYWPVALCSVYLVLTLLARVFYRRSVPPPELGWHWMSVVGVDLLVFALLQQQPQVATMNYTILYGIPILMAATLGTLANALTTATIVSLLLLANAFIQAPERGGADAYLQIGWAATGYFVISLLVHQISSRLSRLEDRSRRSQVSAMVMRQVNVLIIENLTDGIMVVDQQGVVHSANPAAIQMISPPGEHLEPPFEIGARAAWKPLAEAITTTFETDESQSGEITLAHERSSLVNLHARTRLTFGLESGGGLPSTNLCVVFMHDLREMQARLRMEKLAAMGRMSAAVAHDLRNPLAAIAQAAALLGEESDDNPVGRRLIEMIQQNAQRIKRTIEDVLDVARTKTDVEHTLTAPIVLDEAVLQICSEWQAQASTKRTMQMSLETDHALVAFNAEHLHRLLVNLLDNARRYASDASDGVQVITAITRHGFPGLQVWSDGEPIEKSVENHLFEPFFSSESRSTGLGLYICRELCERHGATIGYERTSRRTRRGVVEGNAFIVTFRSPHAGLDGI